MTTLGIIATLWIVIAIFVCWFFIEISWIDVPSHLKRFGSAQIAAIGMGLLWPIAFTMIVFWFLYAYFIESRNH